jgi:hypothetical protein
MKYLSACLITIFIFLTVNLPAQPIPVNEEALIQKYPFVRSIFNRILNNGGLDSFYKKLYDLKSTGYGSVSIVHIGDSHIQADLMSAIVRNGLQDLFGDAGRGLVFPYQLAQSNAPDDISSYSNTQWQFNRAVHPEIPVNYGISGYGIKTNHTDASISFSLRNSISVFNRLKFFIDSSSWILQLTNNDSLHILKKERGDSSLYQQISLEQSVNSFSLLAQPSDHPKEFYGVSLENSQPGILYHTIGVNGVRYDHYNDADLFWKQLPALEADLFIISLGTNEAQFARFNEAAFSKVLNTFLQKLKLASPHASVLITTAPDSYRGRRPNMVLKQLNASLINYCNKNYIPAWDLYSITSGYGSSYSWARRGLMSSDRVHFTPEGYRLQGSLLLIALAKGYNGFMNSY